MPITLAHKNVPGKNPLLKSDRLLLIPNSTTLDVPLELRSRLKLSDLNKNNSQTVLMPMDKLGGCMSVIFDNDKKIVTIRIPENSTVPEDYLLQTSTAARESPYRRCEDKPSDVGVLLCISNVISETILSLFV